MSKSIPIENTHWTCLIKIDNRDNKGRFCYRNGWKNYPQLYWEECKYPVKKNKMTSFIDTELELDDSDNSDSQ